MAVGRSGTSPSLVCPPCRRGVRALSKFIRPDGAGEENQRLTEELAATQEALRQVNRSEPRP
jgi:hypothetical protein